LAEGNQLQGNEAEGSADMAYGAPDWFTGREIVKRAFLSAILAPGSGEHMDTTAKTLVFWFALLVTAALLYAIVQHRQLHAAATPNRVSVAKKVEYSIAPVELSADALGAVLESKGNEGWELAAPVVNNGTTTALIFKRDRK
jgi:hypothetical protein